MALEKGVPCVPALCQSWTTLVGKKPQERGNLECCCGQVGVLFGLCSGVFWLQGGRSHEKLGEQQFWCSQDDLCAVVDQLLTVGLAEFCDGISQELEMLLEKATSLSLGGGSTAVVQQDPSRMVEQVGLLLKVSGWSSQHVLCSARVCWCHYPPTIMDFFCSFPDEAFAYYFPVWKELAGPQDFQKWLKFVTSGI